MTSPHIIATPDPTRADVPRLITTWRHHRSEAERHADEARAIEATLLRLVGPDELIGLMRGDGT